MSTTIVRISPRLREDIKNVKDMDLKKMGVWKEVIRYVENVIIPENFETEGVDSAWQGLSPKYEAYKRARMKNRTPTGRKTKALNARPKRMAVLQWTGHLRMAARNSKKWGHFRVFKALSATIGIKTRHGSSYPEHDPRNYAAAHQEGTDTLPQREFMAVPARKQDDLKRVFRDVLLARLFGE